MIVEIGLCGAAGFLFLRGIYHSGVLSGWIVQGLRQPAPPKRDLADHLRQGREARAAAKVSDDSLWQSMFQDNPLAFWLDPNLWGDNTGWRDDIPVRTQWGQGINARGGWVNPQATYRIVEPTELRPCPNCQTDAAVIVLNTAGDTVTMWHCGACMAEFTRKGETRKSRKTRLGIEAKAARIAAERQAEIDAKLLPCGCSGEVTTRSYPSAGFDMGRYALCLTCDGCWDYAPRMDDTGNPRKKLPGSGDVEWPNGNRLHDPLPEQLMQPSAVD